MSRRQILLVISLIAGALISDAAGLPSFGQFKVPMPLVHLGVSTNPDDWNAIVQISIRRQKGDTGPTACTGSLVGPQTLLTAAHCVDNDSSRRNPFPAYFTPPGTLTTPISFSCSIDPNYYSGAAYIPGSARSHFDFALCHSSSKIDGLPANFKYETILLGKPLIVGDKVVLSGYGCTKMEISNCRPTNEQRSDKLTVGNIAIETGSDPYDAYATSRSPLLKSPAICRGDSGAPAFSGIVATSKDVAPRIVRGISSAALPVTQGTSIQARCDDKNPDVLSYIADLGAGSFKTFLQSWANHLAKGEFICGYGTARKGTLQCL